jgi:carbon monoxide dehydrogenase subunit G
MAGSRVKIEHDVAIARPPEQVWAILGDLAAVSRWVPGVASARVEGTRRVCTLEDGAEIHEEIAGFSDEERSYAYVQHVHPLGFERSEGTLTVLANGSGSVVSWTAEVELADPSHESQILPMLDEGYAAALARLKGVVES